jgi:DivIVA domain-containing protein
VSDPLDDTAGLALFDETATAAGNFPHALRGYDRAAVDAYVRDVESQLSRVKPAAADPADAERGQPQGR